MSYKIALLYDQTLQNRQSKEKFQMKHQACLRPPDTCTDYVTHSAVGLGYVGLGSATVVDRMNSISQRDKYI